MRRVAALVTMAAAAFAALAPSTAGAATCTYPVSAYSDAGAGTPGAPVSDPLFPRQWGLTQIKAPAAWQRGALGEGASIAVIDTGVDLAHPDLQANLLPGRDFVSGGGACEGPQDEHGHGTHVAGIAAAANNGIGVAGTAPSAGIMPLRALDENGTGEFRWITDAIRHAADSGADVINLSLGGAPVVGQLPQLNQDLEEAVAYAWARGAVIVGAAGNETLPLCSYPAAARYALCVGATDRRGAPSYYSNFPADPDTTVGVRAPGGAGTFFCEEDEDIWSTIWPGSSADCQNRGLLAGYDTLAGTSMAAPYASGVAALLAARGLTNSQIMACFKQTSSNDGAYDPVYGYGIVDAEAATATCAPEATGSYTPTPDPSPESGPSHDGSNTSPDGSSPDGGQTAPAGPSEAPGTGDGGSSSTNARKVRVTVGRASRRAIARRGWVRVRVSAPRGTSGRLTAVLSRKRTGGMRVGAKRFSLGKAGSRTVHVKLNRRGRRGVLRKGVHLRVRYAAGGQRGIAGRAR